MSKFVLLDARIFAGAADLSGHSNTVELSTQVEEKETTAFGDDWKTSLGGLAATAIQAGGQWEAGDPGQVDDETWAKLTGRSAHAWTVCPNGASVGDVAWTTKALRSSYKLLGAAGDVAPWEANASGTTPLVRGNVLASPSTPRTSSGTGTGVQAGTVTATQKAWAALHVLSVAGTTPSLSVTVQSSADNTFAAPTDRLTFAAATAPGDELVSVAGAITDPWWRASWTISGTSPSFLFIVSFGIG